MVRISEALQVFAVVLEFACLECAGRLLCANHLILSSDYQGLFEKRLLRIKRKSPAPSEFFLHLIRFEFFDLLFEGLLFLGSH